MGAIQTVNWSAFSDSLLQAIAELRESGPGQVGLGQLVEFACLKAGVNVPLGFGIWGDQLRKWNLEHSVDPFPLVRVV